MLMSNLQISLLGIGAVVIAGVYAFNKLQERKYRRLAEKHFKSEFEDVLLHRTHDAQEDERVEPQFGEAQPEFEPAADILPEEAELLYQPPADEAAPAAVPEEAPPPEPVFAAPVEPAPAPAAKEEGQAPSVDEMICYVAEIHAGDPITADALAPALQAGLGVGKPVYWFGLNHLSGLLEEVDPATHAEYEKIRVALQLADRNGHATEAHFTRFCEMVQEVAGSLTAIADCPDKQPALQRAKELDDFCAEVDVLIGLNVVSRDGAFPGTKIRALAEAGGMKLQPDGTYHYINDAGVSLFTLANHEASPFTPENAKHLTTHGVTLLLDVPRVAGGVRVFNQMAALAKQMANALGGTVVDDNRKPLSDGGIDKIKQQLGAIYGKMDAGQIASGSERALRLFS